VARLDALRVRVEQALALQGAAIAEAEALILANSATIFTRLVEKGVQMARIDDCCRIGTGLQKSPARRPKDRSTPYLRVANVQRNYLDLAEIKELEVTPDELERLRLLPGDVLVVEGNGSIDNIGRTALWRGEIENCVHQNHIIRLRPDIEAVIGEYVNAFLNSPLGRQQAAALSVTTSGLYVLSAGKVRQIQLPLPPIAEQQAVVAELEQMQSRVRRMIDLQVESESELAAMLPAALDRAFRGEL
jgi:type I restriction enzyme S subunit